MKTAADMQPASCIQTWVASTNHRGTGIQTAERAESAEAIPRREREGPRLAERGITNFPARLCSSLTLREIVSALSAPSGGPLRLWFVIARRLPEAGLYCTAAVYHCRDVTRRSALRVRISMRRRPPNEDGSKAMRYWWRRSSITRATASA